MLRNIFFVFILLISALYAKPTLIKTIHEYSASDQKFTYSSYVGKLPAKIDNKEIGKIFFTAYFLEDSNALNRPITFIFNGGPGSSSVWLHMGAFGPYRVKLLEEGQKVSPPYELVENEQTLLRYSDLVFVDPLETGYSKVNDEKDLKKCLSVTGDVEILSAWIVDFISCFRRFESPKFLIGESYGTTRCALISSMLHNDYGLYLNGVILLSCALDFKTFIFSSDNPLPYALFLPSYAAAYWYHAKLESNLYEMLENAREYALDVYLPALMKGNALSSDEKEKIAKELSNLTGISDENYLEENLKIDSFEFFEKLLKNKEIIGRFDCRYIGQNPPGKSFDPSFTYFNGIFTATVNNYLQKKLHYYNEESSFYKVINQEVGEKWVFEPCCFSCLNVRTDLQDALTINPDLRVFIVNGIFDLATPFFATEFSLSNLNSAENVLIRNYESGHMPYLDINTRDAFDHDLKLFYEIAQ